MVNTDTAVEGTEGGLFPQRVGDRLRAARMASGMDLNDIATRTRVPMRHLEAIERSEYSGLPSITYTLGFARSFARAVGLDDAGVSRDLRVELGRAPPESAASTPYEPVDPARVPSRLLAWTTAIMAIALLGGYLAWRNDMFGTPAPGSPPLAASPAPEATAAPAPVVAAAPVQPPPATGTVVLTATAPVWVRVYDRHDKVLIGRELAQGESWTVPADADQPMLRTGRADAIRVTVDGHEVAPLGPAQKTIRDVGLTAAALAARPVATPALTPAAGNTTGAQ